MIQGFVNLGIYRHDNPHASLDIRILSIEHKSNERYKMKIEYLSRFNGRIQYTGKGIDGHTDRVKIKTNDFKYWTRHK